LLKTMGPAVFSRDSTPAVTIWAGSADRRSCSLGANGGASVAAGAGVPCGLAVCRADLHIAEGELPPIHPKLLIPGCPIVGELAADATTSLSELGLLDWCVDFDATGLAIYRTRPGMKEGTLKRSTGRPYWSPRRPRIMAIPRPSVTTPVPAYISATAYPAGANNSAP
jgi:hypothetical protein